GSDVPQANFRGKTRRAPRVASGRQEPPVGGESQAEDGRPVPPEDPGPRGQAFPGGKVPQSHPMVETGGGQRFPGGAEGGCGAPAVVSGQRAGSGRPAGCPEPGGPVLAGGSDPLTIGGELDGGDARRVAAQVRAPLARAAPAPRQLPELDRSVLAAGREIPSVRGKGDGGEGALMPLEGGDLPR